MIVGKRQVKIWNETTWVTVRATEEKNKYRIEPDEGAKFEVTANTNQDLDFAATKELRRQFPDR